MALNRVSVSGAQFKAIANLRRAFSAGLSRKGGGKFF
jgi:hypothetical protein